MDSRLSKRYHADLDVTVIDIVAQCRVASGRIVDISESGVCANLSSRIEAGAIVEVEIGDSVLFGHVAYCTGDQSFRTGIEVVRVLIGESELALLLNAILAENMPATPGLRVAATE
jgi:hypothetical protein